MANGLFELEAYVKHRLKDSSGNPVQWTLSEGKLAGLCGARDPASVFLPSLRAHQQVGANGLTPASKGSVSTINSPFFAGEAPNKKAFKININDGL